MGDSVFFSDSMSDLRIVSVFEILRDSHYAELAVADKREDIVALGCLVNIGLDTLQGVEHRGACLVDVALALRNIVNPLLGYAVLAEDCGIDTKIGGRVVSHDAEGRYVARDTASALDKHPVTDA